MNGHQEAACFDNRGERPLNHLELAARTQFLRVIDAVELGQILPGKVVPLGELYELIVRTDDVRLDKVQPRVEVIALAVFSIRC